MQLDAILSRGCSHAKISLKSKKKALETIACCLADSNPELNEDELLQSFIARERLGTTGLGGGIAIPHCRFKGIKKTCAVCVTLESAIDFDSIDNKPVDLIFAMLVPDNEEANHLQTLAGLAEKFQTTNFADRLRSATNNENLYAEVVAL